MSKFQFKKLLTVSTVYHVHHRFLSFFLKDKIENMYCYICGKKKTVDKSMLVARKVVEDLLSDKAAVDVGVDLRRGEIRMAKHHLNGSEISAAFK